ncbi:MAG: 30S ribosomal protein S6 [Campylobacterota bacterium]|nr:30S ribosomal protein S6 [Campylobacterota bacterium]
MRHYENLVIVKPTLTEEEIKSQMAAIDEVLTANGAEIVARNEMGMRKLAYPINKSERGFYYVVYFTMDPANIAEVERRYRINEELLRFVTMKYDSKREVAAWTKMVDTTLKAAKAKAEVKTEAAAPTETVTETPAETKAEETTTEA